MDEDLLAQWKVQFKDVFCAAIGGREYYFRALKLEEIESIDLIIEAQGSVADLEDLYVRTAVLHPQDINWDKIKAGYITTLADEIKIASRVADVADILESLVKAREDLTTNIFDSMKAFILSAMPYYSEEELSKFTLDELIHKVTMAERILSIQQSVNGIQNSDGVQFVIYLQDPAEEEQKKPKGKPAITKEELLRRIKQDERGMTDPSKLMETNSAELENLDEDLLLKAAGMIKSEDPIARKLRQSLGG